MPSWGPSQPHLPSCTAHRQTGKREQLLPAGPEWAELAILSWESCWEAQTAGAEEALPCHDPRLFPNSSSERRSLPPLPGAGVQDFAPSPLLVGAELPMSFSVLPPPGSQLPRPPDPVFWSKGMPFPPSDAFRGSESIVVCHPDYGTVSFRFIRVFCCCFKSVACIAVWPRICFVSRHGAGLQRHW